MDEARLLDLLEAYLEQRLTVGEKAELQEALLSSDEARRTFWEYIHQHSLTRELLQEAEGTQIAGNGYRLQAAAPARKAAVVSFSIRRSFVTAAAACLVLFAGAFAYIHFGIRPSQEPVVRIARAEGPGSIVRDREDIPVVTGIVLSEGDVLKVAEGGSIVLEYAGEGIRIALGEASQLRVGESQTDKKLFLSEGTIRATVVPDAPPGRIDIATPHAEIAVTGTVFSTTVTADSTRLDVKKGTVRMKSLADGETADVKEGTSALVKHGIGMLRMPLDRAVSVVGSIKRRLKLPPDIKYPAGIAFEGPRLWVNGGWKRRILYQLDLSDGHIVRQIDLSEECAALSDMAWDGTYMWFLAIQYGERGKSYRRWDLCALNLRTGKIVNKVRFAPPRIFSSIALGHGLFAWTGITSGVTYRLGLADGKMRDPVSVGGRAAVRVAFSNSALWVLASPWESVDPRLCYLYAFDPADGRKLAVFALKKDSNRRLGYITTDESGSLWVVNEGNREIWQVEIPEEIRPSLPPLSTPKYPALPHPSDPARRCALDPHSWEIVEKKTQK
jgi:ferric-dicitrate binding protein FerR (iron transport regulator)